MCAFAVDEWRSVVESSHKDAPRCNSFEISTAYYHHEVFRFNFDLTPPPPYLVAIHDVDRKEQYSRSVKSVSSKPGVSYEGHRKGVFTFVALWMLEF